MVNVETVCTTCKHPFIRRPDHQGFANVCPGCSTGDVPRVMGKVAWSGKHTMELEITADRAEAEAFNRAQRRWGAGVIRSITQPRESREGSESSKRGSGAELWAGYTTRLGEKRNVKR